MKSHDLYAVTHMHQLQHRLDTRPCAATADLFAARPLPSHPTPSTTQRHMAVAPDHPRQVMASATTGRDAR